MASANEPVLYVLDFNVGNDTDDTKNPWNSGRIAVATPSSSTLKTLVGHETRPDGIEVLTDNGGKIYWTQMGTPDQNDGLVQRSDLDGTCVEDVFRKGEIHTPKQLAIDREHGKLYVSDREGLRVHRSNLDGSEKEIIVKSGDWQQFDHMQDPLRWCVGICVDTERGYFYWTQKGPSKGGKGRIFRAHIAMPFGTNAETRPDVETLLVDLPEPIDLEMETRSQTLYWTDRGDFPKGNTLNCAIISDEISSEGLQTWKILARHLHEAIGLKIDQVNKHIYVSDLGGCVYRYDMDGGNCVKMFEGQGVYTGIALAHLSATEKLNLYRLS